VSKSTKANKSTITTDHETQAKDNGLRFIFGLDEAGRGPLAGPVVAAAVCLLSHDFEARIDDSKKLSQAQREKAFDAVFHNAFVGIGVVSESAIDELNILNASFHAMEIAVKQLCRYIPEEETQASHFNDSVVLLVDGNMFKSELPFKHQTIIGGDALCLSIACASIVAKVYRDRLMAKYDTIYPQYGFGKHKGYGTEAHRKAIKEHGTCRLHRKSFCA
jgi:ribonuclease HII